MGWFAIPYTHFSVVALMRRGGGGGQHTECCSYDIKLNHQHAYPQGIFNCIQSPMNSYTSEWVCLEKPLEITEDCHSDKPVTTASLLDATLLTWSSLAGVTQPMHITPLLVGQLEFMHTLAMLQMCYSVCTLDCCCRCISYPGTHFKYCCKMHCMTHQVGSGTGT